MKIIFLLYRLNRISGRDTNILCSIPTTYGVISEYLIYWYHWRLCSIWVFTFCEGRRAHIMLIFVFFLIERQFRGQIEIFVFVNDEVFGLCRSCDIWSDYACSRREQWSRTIIFIKEESAIVPSASSIMQ